MNQYDFYLKQIASLMDKDRIPQAMLFVDPLHCQIESFVAQLTQMIFCKNKSSCGECIECLMVVRGEYPDLEWIRPEKKGGPIKIEQIRELQSSVFLSPQRAKYRMIVIDSADRMNPASANALLKILEEPPIHTLFILIAEQLSTVLPTVLSRCHVYRFTTNDEVLKYDLFQIQALYSADSDRAVIFQHADNIIASMIAVTEGTMSPCAVAAQWSKHDLGNLLWFLYLVYAQIHYFFWVPNTLSSSYNHQLKQLQTKIDSPLVFNQIDKITHYLKKISHNMNINNVLALEHLLFDLAPTS